ncbi:unnamed protein product [Durusdinium trenchii]|uniref:Uncharacterized protein n=1 Tax=Durusdinium trenchii TaxID=1381693 RepID=A0ABP0JQI6_9DINO
MVIARGMLKTFKIRSIEVHYSGSWADELAAIMADKNAESYSVQTKGGQGSSIPLVAGGQPGELASTPMSEDFPLIVIPKKAEANPHNPQRPQGLEGLDFMREFINQRAGGPNHGLDLWLCLAGTWTSDKLGELSFGW